METLEKLVAIVSILSLLILPIGTLVLLAWSFWHQRPVSNFEVLWVGFTIAMMQILKK